ncbi:MAG TPA: ABC transporter permease [Propionicimonas sp.]|jgi:ABC-2 type transport system permease protein|uniref:ABC transporter permease n=1 Tax=Propionicimonas sp. TaxID=1955623 RepID=UPI002F416186
MSTQLTDTAYVITDAPEPGRTPTLRAVIALLARDLVVLRRQPGNFIARTIVQPLMLMFALGYVAPIISVGPGAAARATQAATVLLAGMLAMVVLFQGLFSVAMPLMQEFGVTHEIDDRVLSPIPVAAVAIAKVLAGAIQGLLAVVVAFPLARLVTAAPPQLHINWPVLLTLAPLAAVMCSALGLYLSTALDPRSVTAMMAVLLTPLLYLGCTLYPWSALGPIRWVQLLSLANPVTYVSEGFRAAVTTSDHLNLAAIYLALILGTTVLLYQGIRHFRRRVTS